MAQYINKSALVAEIKIRIETYNKGYANGDDCRADALETFLHDIDSLEMKEAKEVNLENEFFNWYNEEKNRDYNASILYEKYSTISKKLAKHFFGLGLNSQTKDMKEALRTEYEKGRADVLRCIDPDEMVADFCSQPLSKTRSLASIYRQGIIDIVKRINNNEKTSINSTHSINDCGM